MAFVVKDYGNGSLGDVDSVSSTINSYARVTAVNSGTITINTSTQISGTATFTVGAKILLHVSATTSSSYKTYLGCYLLANVTAVSSNVLTLDADPTTCIPSGELSHYYVQAIAVAQYKNLTLNSGTTITPPIYNATNFVGGIVALMCSEALTFGGGHISLTDKGIPVANKALRPWTQQENNGEKDYDTYAGWENSDTKDHFLLNAGDGAAFIVAQNMVCNASSRIGNTETMGMYFFRGSRVYYRASVNPDVYYYMNLYSTYNEKPTENVFSRGGSTILIAAKTIENFTPRMIAKYRHFVNSDLGDGQGLCRCYIASETKLRNDEGLYSYDCLSDKTKLKASLGIQNYGDGSYGDMVDVTRQLNNYAKVTAINGNRVTIANATTTGLAPITIGAMVMIHWNHKDSTTVAEAGKFFIANVLDEYNGVLTLNATPPNINITNYVCQVVSIPQANNFTLSKTNSATPVFDGTQGGIFAIAVQETCDLSGGIINVEKKGGGTAYGRNGLAVIGNAQNCDKLPIGQGHGSVFILAQNITMNESTRIGGTHSGAMLTGYAGDTFVQGQAASQNADIDWQQGTGGWGGGTEPQRMVGHSAWAGGYGGNGYYNNPYNYRPTWEPYHYQGAHVFIVAKKITGFNQFAISTGAKGNGSGYGGMGSTTELVWEEEPTKIHFEGGYNGGAAAKHTGATTRGQSAGGSSGWAFIYCNEAVNQNTDGTILAN